MKNSATSPRSKSRSRGRTHRGGLTDLAAAFVLLYLISAAAIWFHNDHGYLLYYGDAESHLAHARRLIDSRTPGIDQLGTPWLPLPHLLTLPFVRDDALWQSGLAAAIPGSACYLIAGLFLYAAVRRLYASRLVAIAAMLLLALNPNVLYLQATPMNETMQLASLSVLFYCLVWYGQTSSLAAPVAAAAAATLGAMSRYESWFLLPFLAGYFLLAGKRRRPLAGILFGALAALAPAAWLFYNWWISGNALEFYNGYYSAKMIYQRALDQNLQPYPGDHDWPMAFLQFRSAAQLCAGLSLAILGAAGLVVALLRRTFAPLALLILPPAFYLWAIHSSGNPIFVPYLEPFSYYNTRYGLAALPLLIFGAASLITIAKGRLHTLLAIAVLIIACSPWLVYPRPETWITWKESQVNSEGRRAWTAEAAAYLKEHYRPGDGIFMNLGDLSGILRTAGIPLRAALHEGNNPHYLAALHRPDLFLREEWAIAFSGDSVATALLQSEKRGRPYVCVKMIAVKGAPVVEIYRRASIANADSLHQSSRSPE